MILVLAGIAAAGTLEGRVVDAAGEGVGAASVQVLSLTLDPTEVLADADGRFVVDGLPAGTYRVRAVPPQASTAAEGFGLAATDLCGADTWTLTTDTALVDDVTVQLAEGGTLFGRVLAPDGSPLVGATVSTLLPIVLTGVQPRTAVTDASGAFTLRGVPATPDGVALRVESEEVPDQLLPGVYDEPIAQSWVPVPGAPTDVGDHLLLEGITVGGDAIGPDGLVAEGTVHAFVPSQIRVAEVSDGAWMVPALPPGDVLLWIESPGLATTYWPDADRPDERVFVLEDGAEATDLELSLPAEARVEGRLSGASDFTGASVVVVNDDSTVGVASLVDSDGTFTIGGLHGGRYSISVSADPDEVASGYLREPDGAEAEFEVPHEGVLDLGTVELARAAIVEGTVVDRYTGQPIPGAVVYAEPGAPGQVASASAGPDGAYRLAGLAAGTWTLHADYQHACPDDPGWVAVWHEDQVNAALTLPVAVAPGEERAWEVRLAPDHDHDDMDDVWEAEHGLDPSVDDAQADPDGDGYTNLEEYLLGTDPSSAAADGGCGCSGVGASGDLPLGLGGLFLRRPRPPAGYDLSR